MDATLDCAVRDSLGSRSSRKLRAAGRLPANLVGEEKEALHISLDEDTFLAARRAHVHLFDLNIGSETESAVVRELQWDAMGDRLVHVEFVRVVRGRKMNAEVELAFVGHPKGVVNHLMTHVTVETIPSKIPDLIEVDVDGMEVGAHVLAGDLKMPEDVALAIDPATVVASIAGMSADEPEGDDEAEGEDEAPAVE